MTHTQIGQMPSHKIFSTHEIIELMIQEYISDINSSMISEEMSHNEINFVHLTMMNAHSLCLKLSSNPDIDVSFLKSYTEDEEINNCLYECLSLIKQLQSLDSNYEHSVIVHPIDFEDHIRNITLSENQISDEVDQNVDWAAMAELNRPQYQDIELNYPNIGIDGLWLIKKM